MLVNSALSSFHRDKLHYSFGSFFPCTIAVGEDRKSRTKESTRISSAHGVCERRRRESVTTFLATLNLESSKKLSSSSAINFK